MGLELVNDGDDVVQVCGFVSCFDVDELRCAHRIVRRVACRDRGAKKAGGVCIDDVRAPDVFVVHGLADCYWVVVIDRRVASDEAEVGGLLQGSHLGRLPDSLSNKSAIEVDNRYFESS